jgi:hypothetical protein
MRRTQKVILASDTTNFISLGDICENVVESR